MEGFDAIIVRCNPGQINAAGGDHQLSREKDFVYVITGPQKLDTLRLWTFSWGQLLVLEEKIYVGEVKK